MAVAVDIDLRDMGDDFVIHYGGRLNQVDAYTFANSLLSICAVLREINSEVNPGFDVEVSVEALGGGSFRPKIRLKPKKLKKLFQAVAVGVVSQIFAALLIHKLLGPDADITIKVEGDLVIVEDQGAVYKIPIEAHQIREKLQNNQGIEDKLSETFRILEKDDAVTGFGITQEIDSSDLPISADRSEFPRLSSPREVNTERTRRVVIEKNEELLIVRAILEKSDRRWQFVWRGFRISAPIKDEEFLDRIMAHKESFTYGDVLVVDLKIYQILDPDSRVYINDYYEVEKVLLHRRIEQQDDWFTR